MLSKRRPTRNVQGVGGETGWLQPLLVDYFTRDGSTLMMRLLRTSPQIAVGGGYPYEYKYFAYLFRWAHLIDKERWPNKDWNTHDLASLVQERTLMMGAPPWKERELFESPEGDEELSTFAFEAVWGEFSRRAAAQTRKRLKRPDAEVRYYAEKHLSTWRIDLDRIPRVRAVALLRDPRDTYVSILSFARKRERAARARSMGRRPEESHEHWLERHLDRQRDRLRWIRDAIDSGTMPVVRYEDLVLDLEGEARRLEEILDVELDPAAVEADRNMRSKHVSAGTPEASVGRWRHEMDPELVQRFNDELGTELEALGFDTSVPDPNEGQIADVVESPATGR
jgi:hypothetical protein